VLGPAPVDPATEAAWVARAAEVSVKRLRDEVRAVTAGWEAERRSAAGMVSASDAASPAASGPEPPSHPGPLDDDAWHASLRREPGRSRRRVLRAGLEAIGALRAASAIGAGAGTSAGAGAGTSAGAGSAAGPGAGDPDVFQADAASLPAGPDVLLRLRLPQEAAARFIAAIDAARAARALEADALPWDAPFERTGMVPSLLAARMHTVRGRRVPAWVGLLALLEDFVFTWDPLEASPARAADATYVRDGWRCAAPACTSRRHLEQHHVVYRSRGGGDDPTNLVTLCRFHHHRGEHDGLTRVRGEAPLGLVWRLGRAALATWWRNERRVPPPRVGPPMRAA
jgi:hypothetical protein